MSSSRKRHKHPLEKDRTDQLNDRDVGIPVKSCQQTTTLFFCVSLCTVGTLCLVFLALVYTYLDYYRTWNSGIILFARQDTAYTRAYFQVPCSQDYSQENFSDCLPKKCGRVVIDGLVTSDEAEILLSIAKRGLAYGGSSGGASILDLHSGALSKGKKHINIFALLKDTKTKLFTEEDFKVYSDVKSRIQSAISNEFNIPMERLYLTKPTFFSRITTVPAQTIHDEYWHPHIDKETYGSFHYTSLLYLTNYKEDFTGGRFMFVDQSHNMTVEPRKGRVSFFTSGSENLHFVEKVESGTRFAITVSFTCDHDSAIADPQAR